MQTDDHAWRAHAACRGTDLNLWFPMPGAPSASSLERQRVADATAICLDCPVRQACLDYALERTIWHGVWGGLTEHERKNLVVRERRARAREREEQTA